MASVLNFSLIFGMRDNRSLAPSMSNLVPKYHEKTPLPRRKKNCFDAKN